MPVTIVEKLLVLALFLGVGGMFSYAVLEALEVPLSQPLALVKTLDTCACGGTRVFLGSQWVEGHWYCYYGNNGYVTVERC